MEALTAQGWGDLAAARLRPDWLGHVAEVAPEGVVLIAQQGELLRLVPAALGNGPFSILLPDEAASAWATLPHSLEARYVADPPSLLLGDGLTLRLPASPPWQSRLSWRQEEAFAPDELLSRHLALLGDWLLARAPESTLASLLPDLLATGSSMERAARRISVERGHDPRAFRHLWRDEYPAPRGLLPRFPRSSLCPG